METAGTCRSESVYGDMRVSRASAREQKCAGTQNFADALTKSLPKPAFHKHREAGRGRERQREAERDKERQRGPAVPRRETERERVEEERPTDTNTLARTHAQVRTHAPCTQARAQARPTPPSMRAGTRAWACTRATILASL